MASEVPVRLEVEMSVERKRVKEIIEVVDRLRELARQISRYNEEFLDVDAQLWKYEKHADALAMVSGEETVRRIIQELRDKKEKIELAINVLEDEREKLEYKLLDLLWLSEEQIYILYEDNSGGLYPAVVIPLDFDDYFWIDISPTITFTIKYTKTRGENQ